MSFDFIPYGRQTVTSDDIAAVEDVLRSPFLTQGTTVPQFEESLSENVKSKYAVAVSSATAGLHVGCISLGLQPDDIVWTSPISFAASANCALYCGAKIDFVDINSDRPDLPPKLQEKIQLAAHQDKLPKIFIPAHLAGTSCPMASYADILRIYDVRILEDASHAVGASYQDIPVGSCTYSDASVFSFHPVKIITSGEGGALTTNNSAIASSAYSLRSHGITKDTSQFLFESPGPWSYEQQPWFNYRMIFMQPWP